MISKCSLALTLTHLCACAVLLCLYKEKKSNFKIPTKKQRARNVFTLNLYGHVVGFGMEGMPH